MRLLRRLVPVCALAVTSLLPAGAPAAVRAAPLSFNECGYQADMSALAQLTFRTLQTLNKLTPDEWPARRNLLSAQLGQIDTRYRSGQDPNARYADWNMRNVFGHVTDAYSARVVGAWSSYYAKVKLAWDSLNAVYATLKKLCTLGHPVSQELRVPLDGGEYGDGVVPMPLAPPWLNVSRTWEIKWWYQCYGKARGYRVEVRAVRGNPPLAMNASSVYMGPLLAVGVNQAGTRGSGVTKMRGIGGPVYLVVRSICASTTTVIG